MIVAASIFLPELALFRPFQPYFSYVSMLQLYEILGWFRADELRKVHAAEGM
jgi:hypothetical protein